MGSNDKPIRKKAKEGWNTGKWAKLWAEFRQHLKRDTVKEVKESDKARDKD